MPEWDIQLMEWHLALNSASDDFQNGIAKVLPAKNACEFCDYDLLCRVEKISQSLIAFFEIFARQLEPCLALKH